MRVANADARLTAFAREWLGRAFEWGRCDCTLLAAHAVDALAGTNFGALYAGRWHDEKSAREFQRDFDSDIKNVLSDAGLVDPFAPALAIEERLAALRRGDLILTPSGGFIGSHVVFGALSLSTIRKRPVGWVATAEILPWPGAFVLRVP
jgi:hypothetical protein